MLSKGATRTGLVFALIGPAGSGKTSICSRLVDEFKGTISLSVSATTRAARPGEVNGVDKHFLTRAQFEEKIARGELFEYEEVHGNLYGQLNSTLDQTIYAGTDLLLDIDIRGALSFKERLKSNTAITFIAVPSADDIRERVRGRSPVSDVELSARLATASVEYRTFLELAKRGEAVDYFIINRDFEEAYSQVRAQLVAERARVSRFEHSYLEKVCRAE